MAYVSAGNGDIALAPSAIKPAGIQAAISAAVKAATDRVPLRWNSSGAAKELPPELLANKTHLAIYLLPRTFAALGRPLASEWATLWQLGRSSKRSVQIDPPRTIRYVRFKLQEFASSPTITRAVQKLLTDTVRHLPDLASDDHKDDGRWGRIREIAKKSAIKNKGKDEWIETSSDFMSTLYMPDAFLEYVQVDREMYEASGEDPLRSDAYGAIGPCGVRGYLHATIKKKRGVQGVYVIPQKVGVRVWDDYDFKDSTSYYENLHPFLGRAVSQFLGIWIDDANNEPLILTNEDFRTFKTEFAPKFNSLVGTKNPEKILVCADFSAISDYAVQVITPPAEYLLPGVY